MVPRLQLPMVGVLMFASLVSVGCRRGTELYPVSGTVTLDGKPVEQATVLFKPETGPVAYAQTDASGKYTLKTAGREGAVAGKHKVSITKSKVTGLKGYDEPLDARTMQTEWIVPQRYSDPEQSGLTAEVRSGNNTFDFALKSK